MLSRNLIDPEHACSNPPVVGLRFHMRLADARHLWPGWQGNTRQGKRVCWMVSEGSPVRNQLLCKYVGRNRHNQGLIGNRGVRRFARSHVLKSGETIGKLLAAGHLPSCANKRATSAKGLRPYTGHLASGSYGIVGFKAKRARDYVVGLRFRMRLADARHLWPGWQGNTRANHRVCWAVIPNDRCIRRDWWAFSDHTYYDPKTEDPYSNSLTRSRLANKDLVCKYVGRNRHNRDLIGNHGARRFALSHVLRSGETIQDLLDAGHPPKTTTSQKPTRKRKRDFTTLDFTKEVFNPRNTPLPRFEGSYVRPLHVDVIIVSKHLAIMIPDFFGDMQALKLMSSFQAFVRHFGGASEDTEFEYLQTLQDEYHDLVPKHRTDGEDILKYFQRGGRC